MKENIGESEAIMREKAETAARRGLPPISTPARRIDGKYHAEVLGGDIVRIVKTATGEVVPHDEPLFLIRGKDLLAVRALAYYQSLCIEYGCTDWQIEAMERTCREFLEFAQTHPERMKQPGVTRGR